MVKRPAPKGFEALGWDEQTLQQTYFPRGSASCVQNFDDSLSFAIRMTYRISLRSSSLWEPRHPLLKVLVSFFHLGVLSPCDKFENHVWFKITH